MIEINLTPNRPDCTGVHGIARDLAAAGIGKLNDRAIEAGEGRVPVPGRGDARFRRTTALCPGFALRLVRGVKNGPSPEWLQKRLIAIGLRPINALVDITNYHHLRPRPAAACVRRRQGAGQSHRAPRAATARSCSRSTARPITLDDSDVRHRRRQGRRIARRHHGRRGNPAATTTTTDVLIESALWDPLNIAQTGRKLGINSDARYRFERGVDPAFMVPGLELATRMVLDFCGGTPSEIVVAGVRRRRRSRHRFPVAEVKRLAGLDVPLAEMKRILGHLGFFVAGSGRRP